MAQEVTVYPTVHFVAKQHDEAWLRMTFPGLKDDELEALGDHLGEKLGWFTWYTEMPAAPAVWEDHGKR